MPAKTFKEKLVDEANKEGIPLEKPASVVEADKKEAAETKEKAKNLFVNDEENAPEPDAVRDGHFLANYVRPHYDTDEDTRIVGLEFSFPLTDLHRGKLPAHVSRAWSYLSESGENTIKLSQDNIEPQCVYVRLDPSKKESLLYLRESKIRSAVLSRITEKGSGATKHPIRYSFQVVANVSDTVCRFADNQYGNVLWIDISNSQGQMF
jgi:hypothetical protein